MGRKVGIIQGTFLPRSKNGILNPMRKLLIAGNWKMYKTPNESTAFLTSFYPLVKQGTHAEILLCPSMTSLPALIDAAPSRSIFIGAQNMHWKNEGAYTGEPSPAILNPPGA